MKFYITVPDYIETVTQSELHDALYFGHYTNKKRSLKQLKQINNDFVKLNHQPYKYKTYKVEVKEIK